MSNHQNGVELSKILIDLSGKVVFMLITASTASIAYILTQIKNDTWSDILHFPIYSLILLAISFLFGYIYLNKRLHVIHCNSIILQTSKDTHLLNEREKLFDDLEKNSPKLRLYASLQFITFIFGAFVYALYVFISIYLK
ncbi:hypothetical protein EAH57_07055 [Acinetobacter sp. 2JN-4]|uniref:hypothetical protein n=1 Tax=Acinetobacter sp. 2JN-4 TaxID=2479844 RepID=UPI000EF9E972|nr:hypothetical protein [Acinetobacter sp. 2JN-4]RLZ08778.1 hypothetical protein EAH57_07055 [Acinetobacter sp. 2JN-4]